ncbi:MAG: hypothetical protein FWD73_01640 [Polyangiaceae bacterium]|nr:hypothetical protein [Polyangiaceae bacterium]
MAVVLALASCGSRKRILPPNVVTTEGESTILPYAGALPAAAAKASHLATIDVGGRTRRYLLVDVAPSDHPLSLVLVFHGDGGDANGFHRAFPFELATGDDAVVAYPDGPYKWDLESKAHNEDVAFVEAVIRALQARYPIDPSRVFLTGYSSGGFFSNMFACRNSSLVRAIASNAGGAPYQQELTWPNGYTRCHGQAPVATMALHGALDFGVTIDSGRFSASYWSYVNGCQADAMETTGYKECRAMRGCPKDKPVVFCEIPTLGHWVWDRAAEASWSFFRSLPRDPPLH